MTQREYGYRILEVTTCVHHKSELLIVLNDCTIDFFELTSDCNESIWWVLQKVSEIDVDSGGILRFWDCPPTEIKGWIREIRTIMEDHQTSYRFVWGAKRVFYLEKNRDDYKISFIEKEEVRSTKDWKKLFKSWADDGYYSLRRIDGRPEQEFISLDQYTPSPGEEWFWHDPFENEPVVLR